LSPGIPIIDISGAHRFTFLVRSVGFIHHESPRLLDLKKYCDAMYTTAGLWGEISNGAFQ